MGALLSSVLDYQSKSKALLCPPIFERQHVDVDRFFSHPFDLTGSNFFSQKVLRRLFQEYLQSGFCSEIVLSSKQNPTSTFLSRFSTPDDVQSLNGQAQFRYQPQPGIDPYTFAEVAISTKDAEAYLKGSWRVPKCNVFVSGSHPFSKGGVEGKQQTETQVNAYYASSQLLAGVMARPLHKDQPLTCFLAAGNTNLKAVLQCEHSLQALRAGDSGGSGSSSSRAFPSSGNWSYGVSYSSALNTGNNDFITTSLQVRDFEKLDISVYQRMVVKRRVKNPFEEEHVVGITNIVDAGVNIVTPIGPSNAEQQMQMALQWQVNKNVCLKGYASLDSVAAGFAVKSWWDPTLTVSASAKYNYRTGRSGTGFSLKLENVGKILYSRADQSTGFTAPTHEAVASQPEIDMGVEKRPLFREEEVVEATDHMLLSHEILHKFTQM